MGKRSALRTLKRARRVEVLEKSSVFVQMEAREMDPRAARKALKRRKLVARP